MKHNLISKKIIYAIALFLSFTVCHFSSAEEIFWQREYAAMVDGEYMTGAYLGGVSYGMTYGKVTFCDEDNDGDYDAF